MFLSVYYDSEIVFGEGNGNPLQYSCLGNPMDGEAWWATVYGVARSQTRLSDFTFTFHFHTLEKEMATHSSALAWRIPGRTGEPGGLPSMGSQSQTRLSNFTSVGGRTEEGSGWGTRVYLWRIHVDIWQNQSNIVKLKNKIKINK